MKLSVVSMENGFVIVADEGTVPAKYQRFLQHVYKYKYVAEQRKKIMESELSKN